MPVIGRDGSEMGDQMEGAPYAVFLGRLSSKATTAPDFAHALRPRILRSDSFRIG
jgi:hypothetical protein